MPPKGDTRQHQRMSALGQKQTCAVQNGISALPPKADIGQRDKRHKSDPWMLGIASTSNKIIQIGLAFSLRQSGSVSGSRRWLRFGILPRRLVR